MFSKRASVIALVGRPPTSAFMLKHPKDVYLTLPILPDVGSSSDETSEPSDGVFPAVHDQARLVLDHFHRRKSRV